MHAMRVARALHRPRQDREVRGPVPRRPRLRADQRHAGRHGRARRRRTRRSRLAWGRGIPEAVADTIIPARYNDIDVLRRLFERAARRSPAIIVEPVLGNAQGIMPEPGFHQAMRALTEEFGILLIFDEVKTGFRFARGGAAEFFGITPDLATYAKAMGNGYPAAAFGGREEVMSVLPDKVSHGGTYAGNRVAAAAAVKTLSILRTPTRSRRSTRPAGGSRAGCAEILNPKGLPYTFTGHPSMFGILFREEAPTEYRDWATTDHELYDAIAIGMHARGAMPEPDSREPWFLCEAHADGDSVDRIVSIFCDSLDAALEDRAHGELTAADRRACRTRRAAERDRATMVLDGNAVRSVDRAAALLLALGDSQGEAGVTELARRLGLHKSTASRLLATLQKRGPRRAGRRDRQVPARPRRHPPRRARRADARPARDRAARARAARPADPRDDRPRHPRRRLAADGRPGRRPEPHRGRRLDRPGDAAPLRRVRQGPARRARRARGPADRPARPRHATRSARSPSSSRSSRSWPGSAGAATRRRSASTSSGSTPSPPRSTTPAATSSPRSTSGARPSG